MTRPLTLVCAACRAVAGLNPFINEGLGACAYRMGWRARRDRRNRFGDAVGYSQFCPRCAPPDVWVEQAPQDDIRFGYGMD